MCVCCAAFVLRFGEGRLSSREAAPGKFGGIDSTMRGHEPNHAVQIEYHQAAGSMVALDNGREIVMSSAWALFLLIQPTRYLAKLRATVP
jgi:hypothetical protein